MVGITGRDKKMTVEWVKNWAGIVIFALIVLVGVFVSSTVVLALRSVPIHYIAVSGAGYGESLPGVVPKPLAENIVWQYLLLVGNVHEGTVDMNYEKAGALLHPGVYRERKATLEEERTRIKRMALGVTLRVTKAPKAVPVEGGFRIEAEAEREFSMGREVVNRDRIRYSVGVVPMNPTEANPFGLVIASMEQTQLQLEKK